MRHVKLNVSQSILFETIKGTWIPNNDNYLFRVQSLAKEFKKQYLSMITASLDPEISPKTV